MNQKSVLIFCLLAGILTGCASVPATRFYTLSPSASPPAAQKAGYSLSVGPVWIPAAVDRPQIVLQTGPNQVLIAEYDRWAAPLKEAIPRVLVENLSLMLGVQDVSVFPQSGSSEASYRIMIDLLRFDSLPGKAAVVDARWTVRSTKDGKTGSGHTKITETVRADGYAELVAAHSRALEQLSSQMARTVREVDAGKP
ncbi:MAG TPA: PqiC family protein [Smithellaceae bacterium]|nr:PqiC family protein [Smithellaceae bacterium]HRV44613.1 PqiC family protein [Smithellaceae bacterium]